MGGVSPDFYWIAISIVETMQNVDEAIKVIINLDMIHFNFAAFRIHFFHLNILTLVYSVVYFVVASSMTVSVGVVEDVP